MANRHFGKLADVWKHLVLCEVLAVDRPAVVFDTHAGNATYPMVDDAERRCGVLHFTELAADDEVLGRSAYDGLLRRRAGGTPPRTYLAGPMLAMLSLGGSRRDLFCDLDPVSCENVRVAAAGLGITSSVWRAWCCSP